MLSVFNRFIPTLVGLIVLSVTLALFVNCGQDEASNDGKIHVKIVKTQFSADIQIDSLMIVPFVEQVWQGYCEKVVRDVHKSFRGDFSMYPPRAINAEVFVSEADESYMFFRSADSLQIAVYAYRIPAQLAIMTGFYERGIVLDTNRSVDSIVSAYNEQESFFKIEHGVNSATIVGGNYVSNVPKLFQLLGKNIFLVVAGTKFHFKVHDSIIHTQDFGIGSILNSQNNYGWALERAPRIGEFMAEREIMELKTQSDFFRKALAHDELSGFANDMLSRKDTSDYPLWQFEKDLDSLKKLADFYGIEDTMYSYRLLQQKVPDKSDGVLLWRYHNYVEYMVQWLLLNLLYAAALTIAYYLKRKLHGHLKLFLMYLFSFAPLLAINGWAFFKMPTNMDIRYWALPGITCLCLLYLTYRWGKTESGSEHIRAGSPSGSADQ